MAIRYIERSWALSDGIETIMIDILKKMHTEIFQ
jgi:hypothetical protein